MTSSYLKFGVASAIALSIAMPKIRFRRNLVSRWRGLLEEIHRG